MTRRIKIGAMAIALSTLSRGAEPCQIAESANIHSVYEVMKNLKAFAGKSIAVRGVVTGGERSFLMGKGPTHITVKRFTWPDLIWLAFPENSEGRPFAPDIIAYEKVQNEIKRLHPRKSDQIIPTYVGVLEVEDLVANVQMSRAGRMALPGWYSLSSVVEIHATLEGIAVLFFAALVIFDVLAHLNKPRETLLERIALVCFAIAVLSEVGAYPYSGRMDTLSSEDNRKTALKIAALNKEAGDANDKAGRANERATANEREAARLNKLAEDERTARVKIEARVAWRRLTDKQKTEIGSALGKRFSTQGMSFWYRGGDAESE